MPRARKTAPVAGVRTARAAVPPPVKAFFNVVTAAEARARIAAFPPVGAESARVTDACGRVLAADLAAVVDLPHFHRANMDGYAVRAADTFGASASVPAYLRLAGTVEMGTAATRSVRRGEAVRISTGGMLPPGADAVLMIEHADEVGDGTIEVHRPVAPWEHVLRVGEDIARGRTVFRAGRRLRARDIGALAGIGMTRVPVFRRPRAALISTGDEIVAPQRQPGPGKVRNINAYSLRAMALEAGATVDDLGVCRDDRTALQRVLAKALRAHDTVLISGGSSVGSKDVTLEVIGSFPESSIQFHGISIAPGKPTILATVCGTPLLGLPGHPQSALVIFELFGAPLLRVLGGEDPGGVFTPRQVTRARLVENVASQPGREDYVRVVMEVRDGIRCAVPLAGKSGAIFNLVQADGLVCIPAAVEGLDAGVDVDVILL